MSRRIATEVVRDLLDEVYKVEGMYNAHRNNKRARKGNNQKLTKERAEQDGNLYEVLEETEPAPKRMKVVGYKADEVDGMECDVDGMLDDADCKDDMEIGMENGALKASMNKADGMRDDRGHNPKLRQSLGMPRNGMDVVMESGGGLILYQILLSP